MRTTGTNFEKGQSSVIQFSFLKLRKRGKSDKKLSVQSNCVGSNCVFLAKKKLNTKEVQHMFFVNFVLSVYEPFIIRFETNNF